jgi:hypothetical protein
MAFLANQNKFFQDTVDYLHKIHTELPAARVREFDILTAVDVLTTGTYQRMPTKIKVNNEKIMYKQSLIMIQCLGHASTGSIDR